jgi:hypothetical protein
MRKSLGALVTAIAVMALLTTSVFAADLSGKAWKVYNIDAASGTKWDINKAAAIGGGTGVTFNFQPYSGSVTSGWFSVYLLSNYNVAVTNRTLSATVNVGVTPGTLFYTRSTTCANANDGTDAYVRLVILAASSNYGPSSYWWATGTGAGNLFTMENVPTNLFLSTTNAAAWTNIGGQTGLQDPAGFAAAMKGVKQVGLAFGSSCRYASGVAVANGSGRFDMTNFSITP